MSRQALKRVRKHLDMEVNRIPLDSYAWPGGYPIYYVFADGGCCCPKCANDNIEAIDEDIKGKRRWNSHGGWALTAADVNYEDPNLICDHCKERVESAYTEDKVEVKS